MIWLLAIPVVVLIGALLYWQLIVAEGAYLGRRIVALLYDWSARSYDGIKCYDPAYEQWFVGLPLSRALALLNDPLILDVAAGTGRVARTLFAQSGFRGRLIGLDYSRKMLAEAVVQTDAWAERLTFIWKDAAHLPFADATFDAVTCLEALEFMPDPDQVLREMLRVLRPGGVFLVSNRIGSGARWMPGRTYAPEAFEAHLQDLALEMVKQQPWQEDYDLYWARKPGVGTVAGLRRLEDILRCGRCGAPMRRQESAFVCSAGHTHPIAADGVLEAE